VESVSIWQNEPSTAVKATVAIFNIPFTVVRFSRAQRPDPFSAERGIAICIGKCVCDAAKRYLAEIPFVSLDCRLRPLLAEEISRVNGRAAYMVRTPVDVANPYRPVQIITSGAENEHAEIGQLLELMEA
jgi:hypothetical protein